MNYKTYALRFAKPLWPWYACGFVLLAVVNLINLQIPQLAKHIINDMTAHADLSGAPGLALSIVALGALMIIIRSLSRIVVFWPGRKIETETKDYLFQRVLRLTEQFYQKHGMGDLISRLANDVGQLRAFFAFGILQILNVIFLTVFTVYKMTTVHPTLTLYALLPLVIMFVVTRFAMPKMQEYSRANQKAVGALTNHVTESFVNVHVIQANAAKNAFESRVEKDNELVYRTNIQMVVQRTLVFPLMTMLAGGSQLVVLLYGGREVIAGRLTIGDILAFNVYIGLLMFPLGAMGMILALYQRGKTSLERIGEIDSARVEGPSPLASKAPKLAEPPLLEVRNLTFAFDGKSERHVLAHVDLRVEAGKRIGLFGPVGCGKSTLFNLITRLYDPPPGTVFLDGQDVLALDPKEIRRRVGYALQSVHLFSASVKDNLAFGVDPPPSDTELAAAATGAQILPEIMALSDGWNTEIGEKGLRLSGGQKQRLALARLFLRKTPLLLLDDVLSAVDHSTEKRLLDHIYKSTSGLIISSHRGSALKRCEEILVLDQGKVVDRGTFAELAKRRPEIALDA